VDIHVHISQAVHQGIFFALLETAPFYNPCLGGLLADPSASVTLTVRLNHGKEPAESRHLQHQQHQ
jgi:hypothetical protein